MQLDALGDPTRRAIFERLVNGPLAVGDIARKLPVSRPAVSQHLKVLKEANLVRDHASGTRRNTSPISQNSKMPCKTWVNEYGSITCCELCFVQMSHDHGA